MRSINVDFCKKWGLNPEKLPRHIGLIMDGNGRWAAEKKLPRIAGHTKGAERALEITEFCGSLGIETLTLFAFSDENWRRPTEEVDGMMGLLKWYITKERHRLIEKNVRFKSIGDREKLPKDVVDLIEQLENDTKQNSGLCVAIALSYGARSEIVRALKKVTSLVVAGNISVDDIDEHMFESYLDTAGLPPLDMFIRTSGELRISNFLLWQMAYTELFFPADLWPDFDSEIFARLLNDFAIRERRFGMTSEQIKQSTAGSSHQ